MTSSRRSTKTEQRPDQRPELSDVSAPEHLTRWYWTRAELADIARRHSVSTRGVKSELVERLVNALSHGNGDAGAASCEVGRKGRLAGRERLTPPFDAHMSVPPGQPITRELRVWLTAKLGRRVRVTQQMRDFMKGPGGGTLADLLALAEQPQSQREIPEQFELNRFMRVVSAERPDMTHNERLAAWREFRRRPLEERTKLLRGAHSLFG